MKPRSRCWKDTVAPPRRGSASASIWSRGYSAGCTANNASLVKKKEEEEEEEEERPTPPSTRGQERVVGLQGLRLPSKQPGVKRPREGESSLRLPPLGCCSASFVAVRHSGSVCRHVVVMTTLMWTKHYCLLPESYLSSAILSKVICVGCGCI